MSLAWVFLGHETEDPGLSPGTTGQTKESGLLAGVLCKSVGELQKCMASLMALSGDEIVKASLLGPIGEEHRTSPIPEEEGNSPGQSWSTLSSRTTRGPWAGIPCRENCHSCSFPYPILPNKAASLPRRQRSPRQGIKVSTTSAGQWVSAYLRENNRVPKW